MSDLGNNIFINKYNTFIIEVSKIKKYEIQQTRTNTKQSFLYRNWLFVCDINHPLPAQNQAFFRNHTKTG